MYRELKKYESINQVHELKFVNFGTGMGYYDFCYTDISLPAFNFSLLQQNLYFDYHLLKKYSYLLDKHCTVCLVLPYFIFCADRIEEIIKRYDRYYFLLPKETVEPYCNIPYEEWAVKKTDKTEENIPYQKALSGEEMIRQSEEAIVSWKKQLHIISFSTGEVSSDTKKEMKKSQIWLSKILKYCMEMQFIPTVIIPPMSQVLLDRISMKFRKLVFYDILEDTVPKNIQVLDYSRNAQFCNPELFGWPGFLTEQAAKAFTRDVLEKTNMV